jgi:alkylhydroperoxidase family enzyme
MGHCEMLLAVAGLDDKEIGERVTKLAAGDWSMFTAADRAAFRYARKVSLKPASLTTDDYRELERHFGPVRALDVVWWSARCHYMTRVADAFQLPLEKENVFSK